MLDFSNIEAYRENNRIEAKKALGGLPKSIWETYSAFANTLGGIILLGVEEYPDHTLHPIHLPKAPRLIEEFWSLVNNPQRVSVNILMERHVQLIQAEGCQIVAITVPRAQRYDRPVYLDGNPLNAYRRSGEGDYKCTKDEVWAMIRDAARVTRDMQMLPELGLEALCAESLRRYRSLMSAVRPGHAWEKLKEKEFLQRIGAASKDENGALHPTAAGLLLFGHGYAIVREFPYYSLTYRDGSARALARSEEPDGVFDFYLWVSEKLMQSRAPAWSFPALREALANTLINADYDGEQGVCITRESSRITFENPGTFRVSVDEAKAGGVSDPRNRAVMKMFTLVDIGTGGGSGLAGIYELWQKNALRMPEIVETLRPDRTALVLSFEPGESAGGGTQLVLKAAADRMLVLEHLTSHAQATSADIAARLGVSPARARTLLRRLIDEKIVVAEGSRRQRVYRLRR